MATRLTIGVATSAASAAPLWRALDDEDSVACTEDGEAETVVAAEVEDVIDDILEELVEVSGRFADVVTAVSADAEKDASLIAASGVNAHC